MPLICVEPIESWLDADLLFHFDLIGSWSEMPFDQKLHAGVAGDSNPAVSTILTQLLVTSNVVKCEMRLGRIHVDDKSSD